MDENSDEPSNPGFSPNYPDTASSTTNKKIKIVAAVILIYAILAVSVYFLLGKTNKQNNSTGLSGTSTGTVDFSTKCVGAGGECRANCEGATAGFVYSSDFFGQLFNSIVSVFSSSKSSAIQGSVVSASSNEIGSYPDFCTANLPKCCAVTTVTTTTTTTPFTPTINLTIDQGKSACSNNCMELGHVSGVCWTAGSNNFNCTNPDYPGQAGKKLDLPPSKDWCFSLRESLANGQTSECCCYDS